MKLEGGRVINPLAVMMVVSHVSGTSDKYQVNMSNGSCVYVDHEEAEELRQFIANLEMVVDKIANPQLYT